MDLLLVTIPVEKIKDWPSFHRVFQDTLGFPAFYGRNMNAWIDCMTYVDSPETGMTSVNVQPGQMLGLQGEAPVIALVLNGEREQRSSGSVRHAPDSPHL